MAAAGVELENAADMARCFPELWPSHDAVRQDGRSVRNCYYRDLLNSRSSHSSSLVTYRPAGAGQKDRQARFDLALIADPRSWLEARLGTLAHFEMLGGEPSPSMPADPAADTRVRLAALSSRLDSAIHRRLVTDRARLAALSARLEAAKPHPAAA